MKTRQILHISLFLIGVMLLPITSKPVYAGGVGDAAATGGFLGAMEGLGKALMDSGARDAQLRQQKELLEYQHQLEMEQMRKRDEQARARQEDERKRQETARIEAEKQQREKEANAVSIGSGFFVTSDGYFVTNYHVVKDAASITLLTTNGNKSEGKIVRVDRVNDLALIKVEGKFSALPITSSRAARRGQSVATVGYPHADVQGVEPKVTEGVISSLSGIADDPRIFQISVPVQSGNSGGPLVTREGNVIGIIVSKLSALAMLKQTGDMTQNVNYAIKSNYLLELLNSENLDGNLPHPNKKTRNLEDVTNFVEKATALVVASPPKLAKADNYQTISPNDDKKMVQEQPPTQKPTNISPQNSQNTEIQENLRNGYKATTESRWSDALKYYVRAADLGSANAQVNLGKMYSKGDGVTKDEAEAVRWYRKAAEQGDVKGQGNLGFMYETGRGVTKDEAEAARWYRKAAEQGDALAQNNLGAMYQAGRGVSKDEAEAMRWYRKAADQGNAKAQGIIGYMYATGRNVTKDEVEAVRWYRKAADQGDAQALGVLGNMYKDGRGVTKDEVEAVRWYRKAADQGNAGAQVNLGVMYENGIGIPKDEAEAARWYRKAAEQGNATGQCNLGEAYEKGIGVPKDETEAVRWYRKAADQGYKNAKVALEARGIKN